MNGYGWELKEGDGELRISEIREILAAFLPGSCEACFASTSSSFPLFSIDYCL